MWKVRGVNHDFGHSSLGQSLPCKNSDSVKASSVPRGANFTHAAKYIEVLVLPSASVTTSVTRTSSIGHFGRATGLSLPLFPTYSAGASSGKRETANSATISPTTDSVSAWDQLMSLNRMIVLSEIFHSQIQGLWLTGFHMVDLKISSLKIRKFLVLV